MPGGPRRVHVIRARQCRVQVATNGSSVFAKYLRNASICILVDGVQAREGNSLGISMHQDYHPPASIASSYTQHGLRNDLTVYVPRLTFTPSSFSNPFHPQAVFFYLHSLVNPKEAAGVSVLLRIWTSSIMCNTAGYRN